MDLPLQHGKPHMDLYHYREKAGSASGSSRAWSIFEGANAVMKLSYPSTSPVLVTYIPTSNYS